MSTSSIFISNLAQVGGNKTRNNVEYITQNIPKVPIDSFCHYESQL